MQTIKRSDQFIKQKVMRKINSIFLFPLITLCLAILALSIKMGQYSPLGKLLDPFIGAVQNAADGQFSQASLTVGKTGLAGEVEVYFDERKVPHIYAKNSEDLYFAQGYVTASLRLWQMDFMAYAAAGRLSELIGGPDRPDITFLDRNQRRLGILQAAKQSLAQIAKDPETSKALSAYTKGVNAFIASLGYKNIPLEYKLMDYEPEPWTDLKSVLIMKNVANNLTGAGEDLYMSKMMIALGEENFNKLFPDYPIHTTPVMNNIAAGAKPVAAPIKKPDYLSYSFLSSNSVLTKDSYNPRLGSNSWAVSGNKTASGYPILASDPHLNLALPSIWLEMQLSAPGNNVYGVTIPGTPAIIVGFNENIAWGITNGSDDVKDWYKLKVSNDYKKYELDGQWLDFTYVIEEMKSRTQKAVYDTVSYTVHGPVVYDTSFKGQNPDLQFCALKWELHNPSNEFATFIKLNKAANYQQYREAIKDYGCPLQNFTFACKDNTIAINHQGKLPVKWHGQGRFVLDGTQRSHLYSRYIPFDSMPQLLNPASNFVLSANQRPTYANYPYYYNGMFAEARANRLQQLLQDSGKIDIEKTKAMQLDNTNGFAQEALPVLLRAIHADSLAAPEKAALNVLANWKATYNANDETAILFEVWWQSITDYTWDELKTFPFYVKPPDQYVLLNLIAQNPADAYFDRVGTSKVEQAGNLVTSAFKAALAAYGQLKQAGKAQWGASNQAFIEHMAKLPSFGKMGLPIGGHPDALNAMGGNWGPSWRMVVELGPKPKAYGIYPGGQSGNGGSPFYDNFVNDWAAGKYYELKFYTSAAEAKAQTKQGWVLKP
jgi:penicillin G amidase